LYSFTFEIGMKIHAILVAIALLAVGCRRPIKQQHIEGAWAIGFYNVENLFDTQDDPHTFDEDFTPKGKMQWNNERYQTKLSNLATVISQMASGSAPVFLGVCEVENKSVLEDLVNEEKLKKENYGIVHIESPDERGIDVGFLYQKDKFTVTHSDHFQPNLSEFQDKTRDILYIKGKTSNDETLHFLINHWPSRGGGRKESEPKRIIAAQTLKAQVAKILAADSQAKIIVMGDFNDEPSNKSISQTLGVSCEANSTAANQLFNAFCGIEKQDKGSYRYRDYWDMLDQIMVSKTMLNDTAGARVVPQSANIFAEEWMIQTGKYSGFPLRTFGGRNYLGGYSDHFPVYLQIQF